MDKQKQIPKTIEIEVYWYEDDNGEIQFDIEEMANDFENKVNELLNNH